MICDIHRNQILKLQKAVFKRKIKSDSGHVLCLVLQSYVSSAYQAASAMQRQVRYKKHGLSSVSF